MLDFIECIKQLEQHFCGFDVMIGHSLGGMSIINAVSDGIKTNQIIIIGAGDKIEDIVQDFVLKLKLPSHYINKIQKHFEDKYKQPMHHFDVYKKVQKITVPTLIIHDTDDQEVPCRCAQNIDNHHPNSQLILTKNLGHRKILGQTEVINQIKNFIAS